MTDLLVIDRSNAASPRVVVVSLEALRRLTFRTLDLGLLHFRRYRADDARGNLILKIEYICQRSVETICPKVRTRRRVDELPGYAQAITCPANASLDHIASRPTRFVKLEFRAMT